MKPNCLGWVLMSWVSISAGQAGQYAHQIVAYTPGTLPRSVASHTNAATALGMPSWQTVDPDPNWGGTFPVDPFSGPYLTSQLVAVGARGSLTVAFADPIKNDPHNPFGIDFLVYGNSTFIITNGDYSGGGITDGTLFGHNANSAQVSVSEDGVNFYELQGSLMPAVDGYFPTDGAGDFSLPVNPAWTEADFAGQDLAGIRRLYAGSAGGTGFDLAWAQTAEGLPAGLASVAYVRIEVGAGHSEIDGFSVVTAVPEPGPAILGIWGGLLAFGWRRRQSGHA